MTLKEFTDKNYVILNGMIRNVELYKNAANDFFIRLSISGEGWHCVYGDFKLNAKDYDGFSSLAALMDTLDITEISQLTNTYVRIAAENSLSPVKIIGNIIFDKWYNFEDYYAVQINTDESNLSNNMETEEDDDLDE